MSKKMKSQEIGLYLGPGTVFEGEVNFSGQARFCGVLSASVAGQGLMQVEPGAEITGNVSVTDALIAGKIDGAVNIGQRLDLEPSGVVTGNIQAKRAVIKGRVEGNVTARETIELSAPGQLKGDITAPTVLIGEGAVLQGRCNMEGQTNRTNWKPDKN